MKVFVEEQRFDQWWFRILLIITSLIIFGTIAKSYDEIKNNPTDLWTSLGVGLFTIILMFFVAFVLKLVTRIDDQGIHYGFWPFQFKLKTAKWNEIAQCYVREYNPIMDYGGWGYRMISFRKKGAALNVKGNIGIQIVFNDGKKLLIGTQKEQEVKSTLETYKHKLL